MTGTPSFNNLNRVIQRLYIPIIIVWLVVVLLSAVMLPLFLGSVSYNISESKSLSPANSKASQAQRILDAQFPTRTNQTADHVILVIQSKGGDVYSANLRGSILALNKTLNTDASVENFTGVTSIYSTARGVLLSSLPSLANQTRNLDDTVKMINSKLYETQANLTSTHSALFQLEKGVNQTAQLVYGIPMMYTSIWVKIASQGVTNPYVVNQQANLTVLQMTNSFGGNQLSLGYYSTFAKMWNASFRNPAITNPLERAQYASNLTALSFAQSAPIDSQTKGLIISVARGLNVTTWNRGEAIRDLTLSTIEAQMPKSGTSANQASSRSLLLGLYNLSPNPSKQAIANMTISLFTKQLTEQYPTLLSAISGGGLGVSTNDFIVSIYNLGEKPSSEASLKLASSLTANATSNSLSGSPLLTISKSSLLSTLQSLNGGNNTEDVVESIVANHSFGDYPLVPSDKVTKNFVSRDNKTMIVILSFKEVPSNSTLNAIRSSIEQSNLSKSAETYVTGGSVFSKDMSQVFESAHMMTVLAGVGISIIIAAILFRSPIAAILPLMIAGGSIITSYAAIYLIIVVIAHETISFLTPILVTLLMLGLGVDYSVILLRRTRAEREEGKTKSESIALSTTWGGQAVITAGLAVIISYIVMAVARVPLFSDIGSAIAIGVSVLLVTAVTLVPAVEMLLGDRLFWPGLKIDHGGKRKRRSLLLKTSEFTLRRKLPIAIGIGVIALGALYVAQTTPTGMDFSRLLPNFPSNQGITMISKNMDSGAISPTNVIVTLPTPIIYGQNEFNKTLMDTVERISVAIRSAHGVSSVSSTAWPFGEPFNYTSLSTLSESVQSQYLKQIMQTVGKDNKTVLITVGFSTGPFESQSASSLLNAQSAVDELNLPQNVKVYHGGTVQSLYDSQVFLGDVFPQVIVMLVIAVYVLLFVQLRSAFTPLRLIYTILVSVTVALAVTYLLFYQLFTLPILNFVPLFVVVTMLGVGIDYDIFLVTRIREEVLGGKSDSEAIKSAVVKVGVTVLGLGLILASVFLSLLFTGIPILQEVGLAVSTAVLFDTFVVILFAVPALMGLAQRLNWWPTKPKRSNQPAEQ
ncbi:MAG: MMPL family transporter [Thaumarchaeota archaeon]|nr:MMPL family transporter [Nitrososphaerota archaeon]MCL5317718.1 MMPL family transporter [Nitrososphaerota archaeon]